MMVMQRMSQHMIGALLILWSYTSASVKAEQQGRSKRELRSGRNHQLRESRTSHEKVSIPLSNGSLRDAVSLWLQNRPGAEATYGPMRFWDTSRVTDLSNLFHGQTSFNSNELLYWDVSQVTSFQNTFAGCRSFDQNLVVWDFSSAVSMEGMFREATQWNHNVWGGGWTLTTNLKSTAAMFKGAAAFNGDLSGLETSSVTDMNLMFYGAISFEGKGIDAWDVTGVERFDRMFESASSFNGDVRPWKPSAATTFSGMFENAVSFSQNLSGWRVPSTLVNASKMFYHASSFGRTLCWPNLNPRIAVDKMFCGSQGGAFEASCVNPSLREWTNPNNCASSGYDATDGANDRSIIVPSKYGGEGSSERDTRNNPSLQQQRPKAEIENGEEDSTSSSSIETLEDLENLAIRVQDAAEEENSGGHGNGVGRIKFLVTYSLLALVMLSSLRM